MQKSKGAIENRNVNCIVFKAVEIFVDDNVYDTSSIPTESECFG